MKAHYHTLLFFCLACLLIPVWAYRQDQPTASAIRAESEGNNHHYLPIIRTRPLPSGITLTPITDDFNNNTISDIAHAGDGRLFILQRNGVIRILLSNQTLLPTPFLDIEDRVTEQSNWELGALGLVFHPDFPTKPYVYVSYTSKKNFRIHIERFTVHPSNPNIADPNSGLLILQVPKTGEYDSNLDPSPVHNGGDMAFGSDGYLYIGTGDGGPDPHFGSTEPHDPADHGQRLDVLLGKILRIDVDSNQGLPPTCDSDRTEDDGHYSIPPNNPYANSSHCGEIWARGLRNPWRFSFDSHTGDLYIADVGEWLREEINVEMAGSPGGANYGWRCFEGTYDQTVDHPNYATRCQNIPNNVFPAYEYSHAATQGCSIIGGFVYRGSQYPMLNGYYVYSDFCSGQIWAMHQAGGSWQSEVLGHQFYISTYGEDVNGELYVGTWNTNGFPSTLYRLEAH